ncbi:uncharacterized protein LOC135389843 isoform X2 [Ornithodoros turicata]|uniref:uncharacterized protein LOC135389843 isoform X2 n=1 Tax=Ornithodoros turicata TaxID=34597 RepID=UPI0031386CD9
MAESEISVMSSVASEGQSSISTGQQEGKSLPHKPLLCSYKLDMKADYPYPPDGLCDFLFHTFGVLPQGFNYKQYTDIDDDDRILFDKFKEQAMKSKITSFGIDIYDHFENATIITLNTDEGKAALRELWDYKIVHYAVLDYIVYAAGAHFAMKISMLAKILMGLRDEYRSLHETENSFFFLGIGSISENTHKEQAEVLKYAMSHMLPDAVLYRATRTDYMAYHSCTFSPPTQWSAASTTTQMSYDGAFKTRSLSTWPSSVAQMMSFSPAIAYMSSEDNFGFNKDCDTYYLKPASFRCSPDNNAINGSLQKSPDGMDVYCLYTYYDEDDEDEHDPLYSFAGYDTPESMKRKMCKTVVEHKFTGGWTMLHMEYSIVDGKGCNDTGYEGNYQMVQVLRDLMKINFTANDCP